MKLKDSCSLDEKLWSNRQYVKKQRHYFTEEGPSSQSYVLFWFFHLFLLVAG